MSEVEIELSEEARGALLAFAEKYRDLIEDAEVLNEPYRSIALFVKSEVGGE